MSIMCKKIADGRWDVYVDTFRAGHVLGGFGKYSAETRRGESLGYFLTKMGAARAVERHYWQGPVTPQSALGLD